MASVAPIVRTPEADVARSGLQLSDMGAYPATDTELASIGLLQFNKAGPGFTGYVIPYFDMLGKRIPFYRVKMLAGRSNASYLQPSGTPSHIYYPLGFKNLLEQSISPKVEELNQPLSVVNGFRPTLMICEGEKKAAKAVKEGFLCCGLGGVYNWRTRTILLPEGTKLEKDTRTGGVRARLPSKEGLEEDSLGFDGTALLAEGMADLIKAVIDNDLNVVIVFDTDTPGRPAVSNVQRAAAVLGYELRNRGVRTDRIRQLKLPLSDGDKTGLDDYLIRYESSDLVGLLHDILTKRVAFPAHPNLKEYLNSKLVTSKLRRAQVKEVCLSIITDMDLKGMRLLEQGSRTPFYFDAKTKVLMPVAMLKSGATALHESRFGVHLYKEYDVSAGDTRILPWIAAMFTGESPIDEVDPRSVVTLAGDDIVYQISDGQFIRVTGDLKRPFEVKDNGSDGILFKSSQVDSIDPGELVQELHEQAKLEREGKWTPWWRDVLESFKFVKPEDKELITLLFYASPWLLRWRGTQLPVEIAIGEPGSGKSSLYGLRLSILTGRPALRNQPTDIRDWFASITSSDGLYVIDNVHFVSKELRQRLSDEICRIVTEPVPTVEMRALYTTADTLRIPVRTCFAVTAIQQPFLNADILQRAIIFEVGAVGSNHDSDWINRHLNLPGGRTAWIAHHLWALHMFLRSASKDWNTSYPSGHRLANFEQIILLMGKAIGLKNPEMVKITAAKHVDDQINEYDWTMQGLVEYAQQIMAKMQKDPKSYFSAADVAEWALSKGDYEGNTIITNSRRLGRYISSHRYSVEKVATIYPFANVANRQVYRANYQKK